MPLPSSSVGARTEPIAHEVDARWLLAFAAGIGDLSPALVDTRQGIVAHPVFAVGLEWPAVLAARRLVSEDQLPRHERLRGVHATHDVVIHRPIVPGDVLTTTATIASVERRRPGAYEVLRLETVDGADQPVVTTHMGSLFLGVDVDGEVPEPQAPGDDAAPAAPGRPGGVRVATTVHEVPANAGHVYTECARIWNPIHTDPQVAAAAGLPGPILHGTATLAMAVSDVLREVAGGDPSRVRGVRGRFGAMVPMPSTVAVRLLAATPQEDDEDTTDVQLEVVGEDGRLVLRDAVVQVAG